MIFVHYIALLTENDKLVVDSMASTRNTISPAMQKVSGTQVIEDVLGIITTEIDRDQVYMQIYVNRN